MDYFLATHLNYSDHRAPLLPLREKVPEGRMRGQRTFQHHHTRGENPSPVSRCARANLRRKGGGAYRVLGTILPHPPAGHLPLDGGGWEGVCHTLRIRAEARQ